MSFQRVCVARIVIGSGRPHGKGGRYHGFDTTLESSSFRRKVEDTVRRAFPRGSTVIRGRGTWRDMATRDVVSEESVLVEVWDLGESPEACRRHLEKAWWVARALARSFGQEAVAVVGTDGSGMTVADFVEQRGGEPFADRPKRHLLRRARGA